MSCVLIVCHVQCAVYCTGNRCHWLLFLRANVSGRVVQGMVQEGADEVWNQLRAGFQLADARFHGLHDQVSDDAHRRNHVRILDLVWKDAVFMATGLLYALSPSATQRHLVKCATLPPLICSRCTGFDSGLQT